MDFDNLENRLEDAWAEYWSLDDSYFHIENSDEFCEDEKTSILIDLQVAMDEISFQIESLEAEIEQRRKGDKK